jgi:MtN3 and saliva related transmembrane protein
VTGLIGFAAALFTTLAFVPQVVRVWSRRSARDVSTAMYLIFIVGIALWAVYGVRIHSVPIIVANIVTLVLAGAVLVGKIKFGRDIE